MQQQPRPKIDLERFLGRLEKRPEHPAPVLPEPPARVLFAELQERLRADFGSRAAGLDPMLDELAQHLGALFSTAADPALDEEQHLLHQAQIEALCATLEDVIYALSLPLATL